MVLQLHPHRIGPGRHRGGSLNAQPSFDDDLASRFGGIDEQRRRLFAAAAAAREALRRADAIAADAVTTSAATSGEPPLGRPMGADRTYGRPPALVAQYPRWGWRRAARFGLAHRMFSAQHLRLYGRYAWQRFRHPEVTFQGMAFLGREVDLLARRGLGRLVIGPWCWIGSRNSLRAHEGSIRLGAKVVLGSNNVVNGYLDIEIGADTLLSDWVYICDFDHRYEDLTQPIRKQGIRKTPVRIGEDVWVGEKVSILRGADIGTGSVIGSQTVVKDRIPPFSIAVGAPARVIRSRLPKGMTVEEALDLRRQGLTLPGDPLTE